MVKWFEELSAVNVNEHIKQKNGLNYLSWMWAWQELKKKFPLSYATVHDGVIQLDVMLKLQLRLYGVKQMQREMKF